ncbi:MAG TPA: hypothetical protein VFQ61_28785 [Polyangiaceae bacterium]|nr:hypothetical protein [Polyangiaceae bacterium]
MKSSSARRLGSWLATATLVAGSIGVIAALRAPLAAAHASVQRQEDVFGLPRADLTRVLSLGYRSALADLLFAHVLVDYGLHFQDKRRFEFAASYLETIVALDPKFREPYRLADTLIVLQPTAPRLEDYRAARRLGEQGLREFPYDAELWLIVGQYLAYLASAHVPSNERDEYRLEGARKLARACELVSSNQNIPYHCITAAALLNQIGQQSAMKSFIERVMAISDDAEIRSVAGGYLGRVLGQVERDAVEERGRRLRALWSRDLTFVSREMWLLLGPRFDPAMCAGSGHHREPACATSFRDLTEAEQASAGD